MDPLTLLSHLTRWTLKIGTHENLRLLLIMTCNLFSLCLIVHTSMQIRCHTFKCHCLYSAYIEARKKIIIDEIAPVGFLKDHFTEITKNSSASFPSNVIKYWHLFFFFFTSLSCETWNEGCSLRVCGILSRAVVGLTILSIVNGPNKGEPASSNQSWGECSLQKAKHSDLDCRLDSRSDDNQPTASDNHRSASQASRQISWQQRRWVWTNGTTNS